MEVKKRNVDTWPTRNKSKKPIDWKNVVTFNQTI